MRDIQNSAPYGQYIRRIAFQLMKEQDELLAPHDITSQQARLLGGVKLLRDRQGACCQKDLERVMGLRGPSISNLIKGLERRGFIVRTSGEEDARRKQLDLSEKGTELIDTFLKIFRRSEQKIVKDMSQGEKALLLELLKRAADNLEAE